MNALLYSPGGGTGYAVPEEKFPFHAAVVYANDTCAEKITEMLSHLERRLGREFEFFRERWSLDQLRNRAVFQRATDAAAVADMVIVALPADANLLALLTRWLKQSFARNQTHERALVLLLGGQPNKGGDIELAFAEIANQSGADFFPHYFDPANIELLGSAALLDERSTKMTSLLEKILNQGAGSNRLTRLQ
jgi:hypothetical protein